tara:strand:+ start:1159 stop:2544 length:1386 start_codon:yes stop_codon:yes gene_type:complete
MFASTIDTLVLSGGGAKGVSFVGVTETFEQLNLLSSIQHIAGTSAGSIFGVLLSFGTSSKALTALIQDKSFDEILGKRILFGQKGTLPLITKSGLPIYQLMRRIIRSNIVNYLPHLQPNFHKISVLKKIYLKALRDEPITFKDLYYLNHYLPKTFKNFYTNAMNRDTGEEVIFSHQITPEIEVASACRGSLSIPVILEPYVIKIGDKNQILVDGGLLSNTAFHIVPSTSKMLMVELEKPTFDTLSKRNFISVLEGLITPNNFKPILYVSKEVISYPLFDQVQRLISFLVINILGQVNHKVGYFYQKKWNQQLLSTQEPSARLTLNLNRINFLAFKTARQRAKSMQLISQIELAFLLLNRSLITEEAFHIYIKIMLLSIHQRLKTLPERPQQEKVLRKLKETISHAFLIEHEALQRLMMKALINSTKIFIETNFDSTEAMILGGDVVSGDENVVKSRHPKLG